MERDCVCQRCGKKCVKEVGHINRAKKLGRRLYCNRACAGLSRRLETERTEEQKKEIKRLYDAQYRIKNKAILKKKKHEIFKKDYAANPEKYAAIRAARMAEHVDYCRRPEYRQKKNAFDRKIREEEYGDFAETWRLLQEVEKEIRDRATSYERRVMNGYYTRAAQRARSERWQIRKALQHKI